MMNKIYIIICFFFLSNSFIFSSSQCQTINRIIIKVGASIITSEDVRNEILTNLSMTKWLYSIIICFIDLGTEEEKTKCKLLVSLMQLNRINLDRSRTFYSEDEVTQQSDKDFLVNNIVSLEDKSFKKVVSVLMDNDMVKVLKNYE